MLILGIESSCDETAASVVRDGREVLSNEILSQIDTHALYGGVVPEIASRAHVEAISGLVRKAVEPIGGMEALDAIAVTHAPGLIGALLVGVNFAKGLAFAGNKPLIPVHHIRGHVAANYLTFAELTPPFTALIASGGHSHIVAVKDYTDYQILGRTRDDAAGESFDKVARVLGLPYPGGPKVEQAAKTGNPHAIAFPRVRFEDNPFDFSFSGTKTAVINYVHNLEQKKEPLHVADIAASFTEAVCEVLTDHAIRAALAQKSDKLVLAGGVAANSFLREKIAEACRKNGLRFFMPLRAYCGDNAAMIASQGYYEFLAGNLADEKLNGYANQSIETLH